jgi:hypothetical protein
MPIASLVRVEILDTPGFNASDPQHAWAARAAFEEADVAVWLLDATQAMKKTERDVLEEARRVGLPVQILVNKVDRLTPPDVDRVLESVRVALADIGIASWAPPLALSARAALAGKLGDPAALERSGWATVETLLDEQIVGRSGELKERALRRRASTLVAELVRVYLMQLRGEEATAQVHAAEARGAAHSAALIERDADVIARELAASLRSHAQAWAQDLELVFVGRDAQHALVDPVLARYRVDRALAALSPALSRAMALLAPEVSLPPDRLIAGARAIVRTAVSHASRDLDDVLETIARAAVGTLVDLLLLLGQAPARPTRTAGALRELEAFARALQ